MGADDQRAITQVRNKNFLGLPGSTHAALVAISGRAADKLVTCHHVPNLGRAHAGASIGNGVTVRHPRWIGLSPRVDRGCALGSDLQHPLLAIDDSTWINRGCSLDFSGGVNVGRSCAIPVEKAAS